MNAERLLEAGARGTHLLFDRAQIEAAFEQDHGTLRAILSRRMDEIQCAVEGLLRLPDARQGRSFVASLPGELQHVIVLLYFELLDGVLRGSALRH